MSAQPNCHAETRLYRKTPSVEAALVLLAEAARWAGEPFLPTSAAACRLASLGGWAASRCLPWVLEPTTEREPSASLSVLAGSWVS